MDFDISRIGFSNVQNFATKAKAQAAAKAAGWGEPRSVYTRFTKAWIVGDWVDGFSEQHPSRMQTLMKDGSKGFAYIKTGVSCVGIRNANILCSDNSERHCDTCGHLIKPTGEGHHSECNA
jgi:hypothetical protein